MLKLLMVILFFFGQMGLLTSFHILFDMPKEDICNSNQPTRERGQKGYLSRQIVSKGTFDSLASKQASRLSFRVFRATVLPHCMYCTVPRYFILPTSPVRTGGEIVYCIPIEPDKFPRITNASKPVSLSVCLSFNLNLSPITKQILILTRLLSELRDSITPPNYHCDHGLDSGIV